MNQSNEKSHIKYLEDLQKAKMLKGHGEEIPRWQLEGGSRKCAY
jgi:hypothetical protein